MINRAPLPTVSALLASLSKAYSKPKGDAQMLYGRM